MCYSSRLEKYEITHLILVFTFIGAILDEVRLHQLSNQIPQTMNLKSYEAKELDKSRDPTLVAPRNSIQAGNFELFNVNPTERLLNADGFNEDGNDDKQSQPQPSRSIYQALKRGLRRLSSIRRNNSA